MGGLVSDSANTRSDGAKRARSAARREPIPLYPSEERIAYEIYGDDAASMLTSWQATARILERNGLPKKNPLFGNRRYWPAVKNWLEWYNGVSSDPGCLAPDGEENWSRRP